MEKDVCINCVYNINNYCHLFKDNVGNPVSCTAYKKKTKQDNYGVLIIKYKNRMKNFLIVASAVVGILIAVYFFIAFLSFMFTDPFDFFPDRQKCEYKITGALYCSTKQEYCRDQTKKMFLDLNDTIGSNTNNQDAMSKTMLEVYNKCLETE